MQKRGNMKLSVCQVGSLGTNCYILEAEEEKVAWIVDPGDESDKIAHVIEEREVEVEGILITHAHYDHIGAAGVLAERFDCSILLHPQEEVEARQGFFVEYAPGLYAEFCEALAQRVQYVQEGQTLTLGDQEWRVIVIPGHSPASVCLYNERENVLVAGDTLFQYSMGRTDFYDGASSDLPKNIREKLLTLPEETVVLPGHGPATSIGNEKIRNPYL